MNLKKTVLSLAIAGITAAPMIASAAGHGPDSAVYGSMRYGVESVDAGGTTERVTQLRNFGSRFGIKGETDLGNGMTAFGKWEAHMFGAALRDFKIGLKGDFGQVYAGDGIDHTWDSFMSTDDTWWYGGSLHLSDGVQSNAVTYMGAAGPAQFGVTLAMGEQANNADEEMVDAIEAVVAFDAGPVNIALGLSDVSNNVAANDPEPVIGFVVKGAAGGFGYKVDFQSQDAINNGTADQTSLQLQGSFGSFYAQYGTQETTGVTASPSALVLGYTQSLGPKTLVWYEFRNADADTAADAVTTIAATLKYEIL